MEYIVEGELGWELDAYISYVRKNASRFPPRTLEFALASWHYDIADHRCPHDSWLEKLIISESPVGLKVNQRGIMVDAQFLGAYHDGYFSIKYQQVKEYSLIKPMGDHRVQVPGGQGDWIVDELRISSRGLVVHEIIFSTKAVMLIECEEIEHEWQGRLS
jgi:hypothetical protein